LALPLISVLRREVVRIHVLQHVPFEGLGSIEGWTRARGAEVGWTCFHRSDGEVPRLPAPSEIDFIIALGGPMSVKDEEELPWLVEEKGFIARAIAEGKTVLGICLGAQLIASALGARVYPNSEKEIGWFPIHWAEGTGEPVGAGNHLGAAIAGREHEVFHWHGETFDLPPGAVRLASSPLTPNQAFRIGERVIGLQFHLETTPESAEALIAHCGEELIHGGHYVQSAETMRGAPPERYEAINGLMRKLLDELVS
jgi:GMP synthase-like glutamine amidotransferase